MAHGSASISSWLLKVVLVVAVLGVIGDDAVSTFSASVGVVDDANAAAQAARSALTAGGGIVGAEQAAAQYAAAHHEAVLPNSFQIATDGTVTLRLVRHVHTWVFGRIPVLRGVATASATGVAAPGP